MGVNNCCSSVRYAACILIVCLSFIQADDDYYVTTVYRLQSIESTEYDDRIVSNKRSYPVEIYARRKAFALPINSKYGSVLSLDYQMSTGTGPCTNTVELTRDCKWTVKNFEKSYSNEVPLKLGAPTIDYHDTLKGHEETGMKPFFKMGSFSFECTVYESENGELRIYLMEDSKTLHSANMYYFSIKNNNDGDYYSNLWKCTQYTIGEMVNVAPYYNRPCTRLANEEIQTINYWEGDHKYTFKFGVLDDKIYLNIGEYDSIVGHDSSPLHIKNYIIGTSDITGTVSGKYAVNTWSLSAEEGIMESPPFIPNYSNFCVSIVYFAELPESVVLSVVKPNEEKLIFLRKHLTDLGSGWMKGIYQAELDYENSTQTPITVRVSGKRSLNGTNNELLIQRIASCSSEEVDDIYILPSRSFHGDMEFYAYDVAINPLTTSSQGKVELKCVNGGLFVPGRNSCECPAGFVGSTCETGCGPDRYSSECDARCTRTLEGCKQMKLCRPNLGCHCAAGLKGEFCDVSCSSGEYGANCGQKCGHCVKDSCDIYTGQCIYGCEVGYYPPLCQESYTYLKTTPVIENIDFHNVGVTFDWKDINGSGTPRFYQIQIKDKNESHWKEMEPIIIPQTDSVYKDITGLESGVSYQVRVVLLDKDGNSFQGDEVPTTSFFTKCTIPENINYNLSTVDVNEHEFLVQWSYKSEDPDWCRVTHFEAELKQDWRWKVYYSGKETSYTFQGFLPGESYEVRVRAITEKKSMPYSEIMKVITKDEAPSAVLGLNVVSVAHNELGLKWEPPFASRGNIKNYRISYECKKLLGCSNECCDFSAGEVEVSTTSAVIRYLVPHAQYAISVAAQAATYGPESHIMAATDMKTPEISPTLSTTPIIQQTNSTLTVQWNPPENCSHLNGYLYGYQYELLVQNKPSPIYEASTSYTSATFSNLKAHTEYTVKVYLKTSGGWSSDHPLIMKASTRATVPGPVENLTVYKTGRRILGMRWALPRETYGEIRLFTISHVAKGQQIITSKIKPAPCIAWPTLYCHTLSALRPDTEYTVKVQATNSEVSEDGDPTEIVATTKERAPEAPSYISTIAQTENELTIEWGLPKMINGVLRSFLVNIEQTDSYNTSDCCQDIPLREVPVRYEQLSYQIQLPGLKPGATYAISVTAKTTALGPAVSITSHTRPPTPNMTKMIEFQDATDNTISSTPGVVIHPYTEKKDLVRGYLLLVMPQLSDLQIHKTPIWNDFISQELKQYVNGTFYIAAEMNKGSLEEQAEIILGTGNEPKKGTWSEIYDPTLEEGQTYRLGLVIILDYCGVLNIGYTQTDVQTVESLY